MLTPFLDNQELDLDGLRELTEFYIAAGADGLFANCLSSEMFQLTRQERLLVTRTVVKATQGRLPVVSTGVFGMDSRENADFIKAIYDTGVDAVVLNTNQLCGPWVPEVDFVRAVERLLDTTGNIPLGMYECPVPYKRLLSPAALQKLAQTGRFLYLKDTSCDPEQIRQKIEACKGSVLKVYNANTPTGPQSLMDGAAGMSPIGANYFPECFAHLLHAEPVDEKGAGMRHFLNVFDSLVHESYPLSAKWFLRKRGLNINMACRVDCPPLSQSHQLQLESMHELFLMLASDMLGEKLHTVAG